MAGELHDIAHQASVLVEVPADDAFAFMADPVALGRWAIGCLETRPDGPEGVWTGTSIFDGGRSWLHIEADPARRQVEYHIGTQALRRPRIMARVVPRGAAAAIVTLLAWREPDMDDARWDRLVRSHELEVLIIQAHCPRWVAQQGARS